MGELGESDIIEAAEAAVKRFGVGDVGDGVFNLAGFCSELALLICVKYCFSFEVARSIAQTNAIEFLSYNKHIKRLKDGSHFVLLTKISDERKLKYLLE